MFHLMMFVHIFAVKNQETQNRIFQNSFTGYYFVVFKAYIAFYHIENDKMFVDRIIFGRSDYMRHLNFSIDYEN